jgi:hypothetical protein
MSLHTLERMAIAGRAASWMSRRDDKLCPGWSPLQPDVHLLEPIVHILEHHGQPSKRRFVAWMKQALHLEAQKVCNNLPHDTQYMGLGNDLRLETDGPVNEAGEEGPGRHEMRSALISLLAERRFHARKPLCHRNPIGAAALPMLEFSRIPTPVKCTVEVHSSTACAVQNINPGQFYVRMELCKYLNSMLVQATTSEFCHLSNIPPALRPDDAINPTAQRRESVVWWCSSL